MNCLLLFFIFINFFFSCTTRVKLLSQVYSDCCFDQDRPVSISKGEVLILDSKEMLTKEEASKYGYNLSRIKISADTLTEADTVISEIDYNKIKNLMKTKPFYYDSIGTINFAYNTIPSELDSQYKKYEKIDHFIQYKDKYIFTTADYTKEYTERNKLYVQSTKNNYLEALNLEIHSLPSPEFLLMDIFGDTEPEILVFDNYYFMNHYLTYIAIYKINFKR